MDDLFATNKIIYDYLSFTTKMHDITDVLVLLGFEGVTFEHLNGFYGYKDRLYYEGVHIHHNGHNVDMGICVEMSGKGCRTFETDGNGDYDRIISLILKNYSDVAEKRKMNITRLDVAYDDFHGKLNLPLLIREAQLGNFVARFEKWEVRFGSDGATVEHGSMKSDVFVRIYDKKAERKRTDLEHWVRCELQLRKTCALGFLRLKGSIDKRYFDTLNNYIRYIVPPVDNSTNKRVLSTAPHWLNFIESFESKSIFCKPKTEYNIYNLDNLLFNQMGGALQTMIDVGGVDVFFDNLTERRKGKPLNPKYKVIKQKLGVVENNEVKAIKYFVGRLEDSKKRRDLINAAQGKKSAAPDNEDDILTYLKKRGLAD